MRETETGSDGETEMRGSRKALGTEREKQQPSGRSFPNREKSGTSFSSQTVIWSGQFLKPNTQTDRES
jgi:hypothetical protein